jgi:protein-S-isoprenylcysteine O-methyltransferase Ste14
VTEPSLYRSLLATEYLAAIATVVGLRFVIAPYGRHTRPGWGPTLPARLGWMVMESPAVFFFAYVYWQGAHRAEAGPLALLALWLLHYLQRTFVFPLRMRGEGKRMPFAIVGLALAFNLMNAYLNARWLSGFGNYPPYWLTDPRFLIGALAFVTGFSVNLIADRALRRLRAPGEVGYRVPRGGLFEWVSCPNYLGEMVEWFGFALAAWSPAGLAFALYTVANLAPRALSHHAWYRARFPDYPVERRALLPYLW